MTCIRCQHGTAKKFGTYGKAHIQRFRCDTCRATFSTRPPTESNTELAHYPIKPYAV